MWEWRGGGGWDGQTISLSVYTLCNAEKLKAFWFYFRTPELKPLLSAKWPHSIHGGAWCFCLAIVVVRCCCLLTCCFFPNFSFHTRPHRRRRRLCRPPLYYILFSSFVRFVCLFGRVICMLLSHFVIHLYSIMKWMAFLSTAKKIHVHT